MNTIVKSDLFAGLAFGLLAVGVVAVGQSEQVFETGAEHKVISESSVAEPSTPDVKFVNNVLGVSP